MNSWKPHLKDEFGKEYFQSLSIFLKNEYQTQAVFPPKKEVFKAFDFFDLEKLKVVIIGQDPYHGEGQANGLCFSVKPEVKMPPSLQNIFKEIESDLGKKIPRNGDLTRWAKQGVLLLNNTLTVRKNLAGSHRGKGWEVFTKNIIRLINENKSGVVYLLWGRDAQEKESLIDDRNNLILKAAHPSPLSAHSGFFGCKHFSQANDYLMLQGLDPIDW